MHSFIIKAERQVVVTFDSQTIESDGWLDAYMIHLEAPDFKASAFVENPGFGQPPTVLFDDIAKQWSGWKGIKTWDAMEGELRISATSDSTGHITIHFEVPGNNVTACWSAKFTIVVEAGQVERLAKEAHVFFDRQV
jgi:hypothetical protein